MRKNPLSWRRTENDAEFNELNEKVRRLEDERVANQGALTVIEFLARLMTEHPVASVRAYGQSIMQAMDDPDAWQAAIAADAAHPLGLALEANPPAPAPSPRATDELSGVISAYIASWSGALGADSARVIGPFVTRIAETSDSQELEMERSWLCADWIIREYTAFWLCQIGKRTDAARLLAMAPVRSLADLELRADPVLSAVADQIEAERAEFDDVVPVDRSSASAVLNASMVAIATGGADAAFEASTVEPEVAVRMITAAQSLWVARAAKSSESTDAAVADLCQEVIGLQASSIRLLEQMVEVTTAGDSPFGSR
jgi:hypothetical protein